MNPVFEKGLSQEENSSAALGNFIQVADTQPPKHFLHAGQIAAFIRPHLIMTILGSCVSVCLWEPDIGIGGMNHYLLPLGNAQVMQPLRFGETAIAKLIQKLESLGCERSKLNAKIFGGGRVIDSFRNNARDLGAKNAAIAMEILKSLKIRIVSSDVEGNSGRKVIFRTDDGRAWVKKIGG